MSDEKQKFVREYQPKDEWGQPIGPPQRFEADTQEELINKLAAAHENASVAVYKTKKAVKLGTLLDTDPDQPIRQFQEEQLTADQRLEIVQALKDPATTQNGFKRLLKSFGVDPDYLREMANEYEITRHITRGKEETQAFLDAHPEYVHSDENKNNLLKYLEKNKFGLTKKNLEIAFEDLKNDGLIVIQAPKQDKTAAPVAQAAEVTVPQAEITNAATTAAAANSAQPSATPKPRQSSSGLGRDNASAVSAPVAPKAKGISIQEINRMPADVYAKALRHGLFDGNGNQTMSAKEFQDVVNGFQK